MAKEKTTIKMGRNKALKAFRVFNRLTQQQLADKLDLPKSFISAMENGRKPVTMQLIDRYAEYFGVPAWEITYLGKAYDSLTLRSRFTAKLLNVIDWITNDESADTLRLKIKGNRKTPKRRASDHSPRRRSTDLVGI